MNSALNNAQDKLVRETVKEIEEFIKLEYVTDAIEKLFDFIRDFTSESSEFGTLKRDAMQLSAKHSRYQKARRNRLSEPEPIADIIDELLQQIERAAQIARIPASLGVSEAVAEAAFAKLQELPQPSGGYSATDLKRLFIQETGETKDPRSQIVAHVDNIQHTYPRSAFHLGPISFELRRGEITGVVGMNASGKTTMLRCLLGELNPERGTVKYPAMKLDGLDDFKTKSKLGYVAQLPPKWAGKLRQNLNFTAAVYGLHNRENDELVDWYVHRYGLKAFENARWDEISGGYKIRFELVRTLLTRPRLLVLDEPLAYLDIVTQQIFLHDLRSLASSMKDPIPIIVTSQHLHEIEAIADRMVIIDDGRCLYSGTIGNMPLSHDYAMFEVELEATRGELLAKLRPSGLVDLEKTALGWILIFKKPDVVGSIQKALLEHYGDTMIYYRDISQSTRSLFRNHRDDFEQPAADINAKISRH